MGADDKAESAQQPTTPTLQPAPKPPVAIPAFTFQPPTPPAKLPSTMPSAPTPSTSSAIPSLSTSTPTNNAVIHRDTVDPSSMQLPPTLTISSPPRRLSAKALGKRPATAPLSSSQSRLSEAQRLTNRRVAPLLKDELLETVMRDALGDIQVDLLKMVKQEAAARQHRVTSDQRQQAVQIWCKWVFDAMREQLIEKAARKAVLRVLKRSYLRRKYFALWRTFFGASASSKRLAQPKTVAWFVGAFSRMGLGGNSTMLSEHDLIPDIAASIAGSDTRDEFVMDVSLREVSFYPISCHPAHSSQAASERSHIRAPSTFLHIIARHIAPFAVRTAPTSPHSLHPLALRAPSGEPSPKMYEWEIILSSAQDSSSAPPPAASKWLHSKLSPRDGDFYEYGDVVFDTAVLGPIRRCASLESYRFDHIRGAVAKRRCDNTAAERDRCPGSARCLVSTRQPTDQSISASIADPHMAK